MNAWSTWKELLERQEPATGLAMTRIIAGCAVLREIGSAWSSGAARAVWVSQQHGGMAPKNLSVLGASLEASLGTVTLLSGAGMLAAMGLVLGLATPVMAFATWTLFRALSGSHPDSGGSGDDLLIHVLFILVFAGAGRTLSIDAWRRGREELAPVWPRVILITQLVIMYTMSGLHKLSLAWLPGGDGDALWYILQQPTWQRQPMTGLWPLAPLIQIATVSTWLFEVSAPVLLLAFWYRATWQRPGKLRAWFLRVDLRAWYLGLGLLFHLGIESTLEVGAFVGGTLAIYASTVSAREWQRLRSRWTEATGG